MLEQLVALEFNCFDNYCAQGYIFILTTIFFQLLNLSLLILSPVALAWLFFFLYLLSLDAFILFSSKFRKKTVISTTSFIGVFHCVKSVQIWSFFWSVFSCIRTRKKSVFGHFSRSFYDSVRLLWWSFPTKKVND